MKIYFLIFVLTAEIPKYRKLPFVIETLPDYFGFDIEDFDGVKLE